MEFVICGVFFILASLAFVATYHYLVPRFTNNSVGYATSDLWQKMLLGFVLAICTALAYTFLVPYFLMTTLLIVMTSGPAAPIGILGVALIAFVVNTVFYGVLTHVCGLSMKSTLRCGSLGAAFKAGLAVSLVTTLISAAGLVVLISNLKID